MNLWLAIAIAWAGMVVVMSMLWFVQRRTGNAGIVDIAWSFGTGLCAVWFACVAAGDEPRRWIVGILAGVWGARLGLHLLRRVLSEAEDGRYKMLRERWGDKTQIKLFGFFQLQALWAMLFALPMLVAASNPTHGLKWTDYAAIVVWIAAIGGESIADAQLSRFRHREENRGKVCQDGLWRYSRHPNYFFEWIHWFSYVLLALSAPADWAWGWLSLLGPAVMLWFLLKVTGVPMTEARAVQSRGDAYRAYQRTTNAFFPGPPRKERL